MNFTQTLQEQFQVFRRDTIKTGEERVGEANKFADRLIDNGHIDGVLIGEWRDRVNDAWADLLELIETRVQVYKYTFSINSRFASS